MSTEGKIGVKLVLLSVLSMEDRLGGRGGAGGEAEAAGGSTERRGMTREERKLVAAVEISQKLEKDRQRKQDQASTGKEADGKRLAADEAARVSNSSTRKRRRGEEADAAGACAAKKKKPLSVCPHQRRRDKCKECGGASICRHQRIRSRCKECGGSGICQHQRFRSKCKECRDEADTWMLAGLEELAGPAHAAGKDL